MCLISQTAVDFSGDLVTNAVQKGDHVLYIVGMI